MYRNTRLRIAAALAAGICLLFSQLAVAVYACPVPTHAPGAEMAMQSMDQGDNGDMDLCAGHDAARPELCRAHCSPADLSLSHAQFDAPPVMLVALHPLAAQCGPAVLQSTAPRLDAPLQSHSPPLSILHCCFRI